MKTNEIIYRTAAAVWACLQSYPTVDYPIKVHAKLEQTSCPAQRFVHCMGGLNWTFIVELRQFLMIMKLREIGLFPINPGL